VTRALAIGLVCLAGCLGGQSMRAEDTSKRQGDQSQAVPASVKEKDWQEAARGHGAVGSIPREALDRMERESAPGGGLGTDAGAH
jgi:hypothetical protein